MNQLSLNIPTAYEPELNHPARYINQLVEGLAIRKPNIMGATKGIRSENVIKIGPFSLQLRYYFLSEN